MCRLGRKILTQLVEPPKRQIDKVQKLDVEFIKIQLEGILSSSFHASASQGIVLSSRRVCCPLRFTFVDAPMKRTDSSSVKRSTLLRMTGRRRRQPLTALGASHHIPQNNKTRQTDRQTVRRRPGHGARKWFGRDDRREWTLSSQQADVWRPAMQRRLINGVKSVVKLSSCQHVRPTLQ